MSLITVRDTSGTGFPRVVQLKVTAPGEATATTVNMVPVGGIEISYSTDNQEVVDGQGDTRGLIFINKKAMTSISGYVEEDSSAAAEGNQAREFAHGSLVTINPITDASSQADTNLVADTSATRWDGYDVNLKGNWTLISVSKGFTSGNVRRLTFELVNYLANSSVIHS